MQASYPFQTTSEPDRPTVSFLRRTVPAPSASIARWIVGGPLLFDALNKLVHPPTRAATLEVLQRGDIPSPGTVLVAVAIGEALAGTLLVPGLLARPAAVLGVISILFTLYLRVQADDAGRVTTDLAAMPGQPTLVLFLAFAAALYVIARGAGAWSSDNNATRAAQ